MSIIYCATCDDAYDSDHHDHGTICKRCLSGISTQYVYPPIPDRRFDWAAHFDNYDGAPDAGSRYRAIGYGPTEEAAVEDLIQLVRC